ncbi:MAG: signal recognition particle protein [Candidatus Dasytiphilus stammeri]
MFENLTDRLWRSLRNISDRGRLTEDNINQTLREVRIALLEADVALPVVREFIHQVKSGAIGKNISTSLTPGQEFIKIVKRQLIQVMEAADNKLNLSTSPPAVILVAGLQGTGKTTSIVKISKFIRDKYKKNKVMLVSVDIYRPAALNQIKTLADQAGIYCYPSELHNNAVEIANSALLEAKLKFYDVLLVDTAGSMHVDTEMMKEIQHIHSTLKPVETLLVVDAMTGQDTVNYATIFNNVLPITGVILTKIDGDARGGAALSIRYLTGKPIKFLGFGEKIDALEPFDPKRIASRILGMGDMLSLIDEIENTIDHRQAENLVKKMKTGAKFNLSDFLEQLKEMRNIGGINKILDKIPVMNSLQNNMHINEKQLVYMEAIINSMTLEERRNPDVIKGSRKRRIARGSGVQVQDVNRLLKQFGEMQIMMKNLKRSNFNNFIRNIKGMITQFSYR